MKIKQRRTFLYISNIVISVICLASMLGYFLMPVFRAEFAVSLTPELAEQIADSIQIEDGETVNTLAADADSVKSMLQNVIRAVGQSGLKISFSFSFSSVSFIGALFDRNPERVDALIDDAVDQFVDNAKETISVVIASLASAAAKEVVKVQVGEIIKDSGGESYDSFIEEIGEEKSLKIDSLIERLIKAITDENATVSSVTETALECADEVIALLSGVDKYSGSAESFGEEEKNSLREMCNNLLSQFADETGRLQFKDMLIGYLIEMLNGAVENGGVDLSDIGGGLAPSFTASPALLSSAPRATASASELADTLKLNLKKAFYDAANGNLPDFVLSLMAVSGALILVCLFMLFYPILRTLTNIGLDEPGYSLALPIIGGLFPFLLLVVIPSAAPTALKLFLSGRLLNVPQLVSAIVNSVYISYFSGTIIAFFAAIALFIFGFFYAHQRKLLRRELKAAVAEYEKAQAEAAAQTEDTAKSVEEKQS